MGFNHVIVAAKSVHVKRPLKTYDRPLDGSQQRQRHDDRHRNPYRQVLRERKVGRGFDSHECADDDMADDEYDQIGGQVVGAMVMKRFTAASALVMCPDEGSK